MIQLLPSAFQGRFLIFAAIGLVSGVRLLGAELLPRSPGRLGGDLDTRIVPRADTKEPFGRQDEVGDSLEMGLKVSSEHDDNIYFGAIDPREDLVTKVAPAVAYRRGDDPESRGGYLSVAYQPAAVIYAEHRDNNRVDQDLAWELGWRSRAIRIVHTGSARHLGDATADTGTLTDRIELANSLRVAWSPRERLGIEVAVGRETASYDSPVFRDSETDFGEVALRYDYSPKTRLGLAYRAGRLDASSLGEQRIHRSTGRIEWQPTSKISVDLEAGVERRAFENGSRTTPAIEARVAWMAREGTEVYLGGYRREQASAFLPGENFSQGGVEVGASQRLGGHWFGRIEGGVERAAYSRVSGTGISGRVDRIRFIRPSLEYRFTDHFSMGLFYRHLVNRSNRETFGYESHGGGVEMGYRF